MDLNLIFYFLAGIAQDFLITLNWRYVTKNKAVMASLFSFLVTIVTMIILYKILVGLDSEQSAIAIIVYALGIGVGTFLGMRFKIT
jgi:uncharacterized protein YebE (UPF0316 family)